MGQSACAKLLYGVIIGNRDDELPEWFTRHAVPYEGQGEEHPFDCDLSALVTEGVDIHIYGHYECSSMALGVSLAWAIGYREEEVDPLAVRDAITKYGPVLVKLLKDMGAPVDVVPKLLLLPEFG